MNNCNPLPHPHKLENWWMELVFSFFLDIAKFVRKMEVDSGITLKNHKLIDLILDWNSF